MVQQPKGNTGEPSLNSAVVQPGRKFLMNKAHVLYEVKGHVAVITLNRPKSRNAFSAEMITLWNEYLESARDECLVLHGYRWLPFDRREDREFLEIQTGPPYRRRKDDTSRKNPDSGPKGCAYYRAGPKRKVPGRKVIQHRPLRRREMGPVFAKAYAWQGNYTATGWKRALLPFELSSVFGRR